MGDVGNNQSLHYTRFFNVGLIKGEALQCVTTSQNQRTELIGRRIAKDGLERVPPEQHPSRSGELDAIASHMGVPIQELPCDRAVYVPAHDRIELPPRTAFSDQYGYDSTRAHELAHATGHAKRLNRDLGGAFGTARYAAEEVTAEIGSFLMCQELAIPYRGGNPDLTADQHVAYLASWATVLGQDPKVLGPAIQEGARAATYLSRQLTQAREQALTLERMEVPAPQRGRDSRVALEPER